MPLCSTCQNPRKVGYGLDCVPGDQIVFDRSSDTRPYFKAKCPRYSREIVPGSRAALIAAVCKGQQTIGGMA
jgi:hypothetical protein